MADEAHIGAGAMSEAFAQALHQAEDDGLVGAAAVWRAFAQLVRRRVVADGQTETITEDLLLFDVSRGDRFPPLARFVRRVGIADANGDYVGAEVFECQLGYTEDIRERLRTDGALMVSLEPDRPLADVEGFLRRVEASQPFHLLILQAVPAWIESTPGRG